MFDSKKKKALNVSELGYQVLSPCFHIVRSQNNNVIPEVMLRDKLVLGYMTGVFLKIWASSGIDIQSRHYDLSLETYFSNFFPSKGAEIVDYCSSITKQPEFKRSVSLGAEECEKIFSGTFENNQLTEHFLKNY